eukprot:scaffold103650_cov48-Phaeocystis_antarctica.AAC.1
MGGLGARPMHPALLTMALPTVALPTIVSPPRRPPGWPYLLWPYLLWPYSLYYDLAYPTHYNVTSASTARFASAQTACSWTAGEEDADSASSCGSAPALRMTAAFLWSPERQASAHAP